LGALAVILSQARTSCQVVLAKGHSSMRWCMVSGAWSHRGQRVWCCKPCLARRSAVQHLSRLASQWKNFTRGGAQVFQISFQEWQATDP
jgi:hypothetical protein